MPPETPRTTFILIGYREQGTGYRGRRLRIRYSSLALGSWPLALGKAQRSNRGPRGANVSAVISPLLWRAGGQPPGQQIPQRSKNQYYPGNRAADRRGHGRLTRCYQRGMLRAS